MKRLLLSLLCIGFLCCLSSPVHSITLYQVGEGDDAPLPPPGSPPTLPYTSPYDAPNPRSFAPVQVAVIIEVYNNDDILVHSEKRLVSPSSNIEVNTDNWAKGKYTVYVKTANAVIKAFTINCK